MKKKKYLNRSKHAKNRVRDNKGRFISKQKKKDKNKIKNKIKKDKLDKNNQISNNNIETKEIKIDNSSEELK